MKKLILACLFALNLGLWSDLVSSKAWALDMVSGQVISNLTVADSLTVTNSATVGSLTATGQVTASSITSIGDLGWGRAGSNAYMYTSGGSQLFAYSVTGANALYSGGASGLAFNNAANTTRLWTLADGGHLHGYFGMTTTTGTFYTQDSNGTGVLIRDHGSVNNGQSTYVQLQGDNAGIIYKWLLRGMTSDGRFNIYDNEGGSTGERLTIDQAGLVGIGTASPSSLLHLKGNSGLLVEIAANDSRASLGFTGANTWGLSASYGSTGAYYPLSFYTSDLERMRLDTSGNLSLYEASADASRTIFFGKSDGTSGWTVGSGATANDGDFRIYSNDQVVVPLAISDAAGNLISLHGSTLTISSSGDITPGGRLKVPMGEVAYFNMTGTLITAPGTSDGSTNMTLVNPPSTFTTTSEQFTASSNGRLLYTGSTTRMFHIAITVSGTPATANDIFVWGAAKNGTVLVPSKVLGSSSGTQFSSLHVYTQLATNDYLELYIGNTTATRNFTVKSLNIFAMGM